MPLVPCPACALAVSPQAAACPRCGQPIKSFPGQGASVAISSVRILGCLILVGSIPTFFLLSGLLGVLGTVIAIAMGLVGLLMAMVSRLS